MDLYFMSPPHPGWSLRGRANFRSRAAAEVDATRARLEWLSLAEGIESLGGKVVVLEPASPESTGLPYAAEAGHPLPALEAGGKPRFLLPRMKPEHRRGEKDLWRPLFEAIGFDTIELGVGIWEGQGDVATFDGTTLLFWGGRTDRVGAQAARAHFSGDVIEVEIREPAFHGNMALCALDHADTMLVCADVIEEDSVALLEARFGKDRIHLVSEDEIRLYATNGLPVGDTVLAPSILPERVRKVMERGGMKVAEIAMPELCEKAGGASRCLVCKFADAPAGLVIPDEMTLSTVAPRIRSGL
jgi:N-dimethylarginine dimethylaminohydrolase